MLSSRFGHFLDKPLAPLFKKIKLSPYFFTIAGFVITFLAAFSIQLSARMAGALMLLGGFFDMLDGVAARVNNKATKFGAFFDSVIDRYSDSFIFVSITWYLISKNDFTAAYVAVAVLVGALVISYAKARAEGLGETCDVGIMERPERIVLIAFALLANLLVPVLWIMFALTHMTVAQRVYHVWIKTKKI